MEATPLVSIIIPIYNAEKHLIKCLKSIQKQTYSNFEAILVDDCSNDKSFSICSSFAEQDRRFKVIQTPHNSGAGDARWLGVKESKGDFIGFADSDDWLGKNFLLCLLQTQQETQADIVSCQALHCQNDGTMFVIFPINLKKVFSPKEALALLDQEYIIYPVLWDKLYKREIILSERIRSISCEDGYALVKYIQQANKIAYYGLPLYHYNREDNTLSGSVSRIEHYKFYCHLAQTLKEEYEYLSPHIIKTGIKHFNIVCCFRHNKKVRTYIINQFIQLIKTVKNMRCNKMDRLKLYCILNHTSAYIRLYQSYMRLFHKKKYKNNISIGYKETRLLLKEIVQNINKTNISFQHETFDHHNLFE